MEDERRALAARMTDKAAKLLLDMPLRQMRRLEEMPVYSVAEKKPFFLPMQ